MFIEVHTKNQEDLVKRVKIKNHAKGIKTILHLLDNSAITSKAGYTLISKFFG